MRLHDPSLHITIGDIVEAKTAADIAKQAAQKMRAKLVDASAKKLENTSLSPETRERLKKIADDYDGKIAALAEMAQSGKDLASDQNAMNIARHINAMFVQAGIGNLETPTGKAVGYYLVGLHNEAAEEIRKNAPSVPDRG